MIITTTMDMVRSNTTITIITTTTPKRNIGQ
jgi:hypothetical protein